MSAAMPLPPFDGGDDLPGRVVDSRALELAELLPGCATGFALTYATHGARGEPRTATATLHLPEGAERPPVMVFCHGTTGVGEHCAVSFGIAEAMGVELRPWVDRGIAFLVVDYAGLGSPGPHAYLHAESAARQVIDALLSAHELVDGAGLELDERWLLMGGSQGGHTALASSMQSSHALDLDLCGVVALAPASNLMPLLRFAGPWVPRLPVRDLVAYLAYILHGLEASRPDLRPEVDRLLTDHGRTLVDSSPWYGYAQFVERTHGQSVGKMLRRPLAGTAVLRAIGETSTLPVVRHSAPVLVQQGLFDPVVPWFGSRRYVSKSRAAGSTITLRTYRTNHNVWDAAKAEALQFALDCLETV